jgi:hypothetical protein
MSNITDHFTWDEATSTHQRDPRTGLMLPNEPGPQVSASLVHTFSELERVRALFGRPVRVNSAYRSPVVNAAVGGSRQSQHLRGEAVDFVVQGVSVLEAMARLCRSTIPFDQLIEEGSWLHASFVSWRGPRRQALTMRVVDGRAAYRSFNPETP